MSKIEWTDRTWNPIIGCSKISEGCKECYAEKMACRLVTMEKMYDRYRNVCNGNNWTGHTSYVREVINHPKKWKKPQKIFVCSMGDIFHESVPFLWIDRVLDVMNECQHHTFIILTKRPERMKLYFEYLAINIKESGLDSIPSQSKNKWNYIDPLPNLWIGVSVENQKTANERIPILLEIPAAKRIVSCEPLLSDIELSDEYINFLKGYTTEMRCYGGIPTEQRIITANLDWVIAGPETGLKARPMQKEWIESIYRQCEIHQVPFFDKKNILGLDLKQFPNEQ